MLSSNQAASGAADAAAVAAGCAHHRAGAQHRAVSRPGAADHARPAEIDRGRATGGARSAAGRHPDAARRRRSPIRRRSTCIAWARSRISCATSRRRTARTISSARASSASRSSEFLSGWPFFVARVLRIPEPRDRHRPRSRRASSICRRRPSRRSSCCRRRRRNCWPRSNRSSSPGALADLAVAYMDVKPEEKQEILETHRYRRAHGQGLAAAGASHRGAAAVAGDRPADQGGARRAPARGAVARADGGDPAPARRRRGGQGRRDGRARQGDHQGRTCRRRSRSRRARSCAGCSACRKPPANTAWCAPISIG